MPTVSLKAQPRSQAHSLSLTWCIRPHDEAPWGVWFNHRSSLQAVAPAMQERQSGDSVASLPTGPCLSSWIAWLAQTVLSVQQPRAGWFERSPSGMWPVFSNPCSCCCSSPKPRGRPSSVSSRRTQPVSSLTVPAVGEATGTVPHCCGCTPLTRE